MEEEVEEEEEAEAEAEEEDRCGARRRTPLAQGAAQTPVLLHER